MHHRVKYHRPNAIKVSKLKVTIRLYVKGAKKVDIRKDDMRGNVMMVKKDRKRLRPLKLAVKCIQPKCLILFCFSSVKQEEDRDREVPPCTSHHLKITKNSSLKHIIYIKFSMNSE